MPECRVCGTPILIEGRCYSCSTGAVDGYDTVVADLDRLAAENAELRKAYEQQYEAMNVLVQELKQRDATLDALRDLCGPNRTISNSTCMKAVDILYPQPKETSSEEQ